MVGVSAYVNLPLHHKVQKFLFWHQLSRIVLEEGPWNGCGDGVVYVESDAANESESSWEISLL